MDFPPITVEKAKENLRTRELFERLRIGSEGEGDRVEVLSCAPCSRACPAGIDVKGYVSMIADGRFDDAEELIRRENPLAEVCGWICARPCERECTRGCEQEAAVPIRALKRFVCRFVADSGARCLVERAGSLERKVAVVGAGPAGLAASRDLARAGVDVTLLEKRSRPGGLLAWEVPRFRLPREVVERDVESVLRWGVKLRCNTEISDREGFKRLVAENDAVVLATGSTRGLTSGLPGEEGAAGVRDALSVLRNIDSGQYRPSARIAFVLGGSGMAVSAARALARVGVPKVFLVSQVARERLSADPAEVEAARSEGVELLAGRKPVEVLSTGGRFSGLVCRRVVGEGDGDGGGRAGSRFGSGSFRLGAEERLDGELLVSAWAREPECGPEVLSEELEPTLLNTLSVDPESMMTPVEGVFGAGEAATGQRGVVEAVASGRRAARSVLAFLRGDELGGRTPSLVGAPWEVNKRSGAFEPEPDENGFRVMLRREGRGRAGLVSEVLVAPSFEVSARRAATLEHEAMKAARECLRCGVCEECASCSVHCPDGFVKAESDELIRVDRQAPFDPGEIEGQLLIAAVDPAQCRGCGSCEQACPYHAARVRFGPKRSVASVDPDYCRGCGKCAAVCPTGAVAYPYGPDELWTKERDDG